MRSRESNTAVRSLLSRHNDEYDPHSSFLPVAAMVWSALSAASSQVPSATAASPLMSTAVSDRLPLGLKRYYMSSSPDFVLSQTSIPKEVLSGSAPNIVLGSKVKSLEEHVRLDLACHSTSEWLLAAVSSILQGCPEACDSAVSLEGLKESCVTSLNTSLDLISSAWLAIQDGTLASVAWLNAPLLDETPFSGS